MSNAVDEIAERIRSHIVDRRLESGARLPAERNLAESLGYSRPSIRQGIQRLNDIGLVETRRGSGTYYTPIDLKCLLEVRLQLEPWASAGAAEHRTRAQASALMRTAAKAATLLQNTTRFAANDSLFHRQVAAASGNPVLSSVLNGLADMLATSRSHTTSSLELREQTSRQLVEIASAIERHEREAAAAAMRDHLEQIRPMLPQEPNPTPALEAPSGRTP